MDSANNTEKRVVNIILASWLIAIILIIVSSI